MFAKNKQSHPADALIKAYFDWDYDVNHSSRRQAKVAYWIAGAMFVLAALSIFALNGLTPLKDVKPIVITVDKSTGIADVKHNLTGVDINNQEALDKYFLGTFIRAYESYAHFSHSEDRDTVLSMSDGRARKAYQQSQHKENPQAFLNTYKDNYQRKVTIKEVLVLDKKQQIGQARFYIEDGRSDQPHYFTATIKYTYLEESSIPFTFLLKNPLGFVVTEYKVDEITQ